MKAVLPAVAAVFLVLHKMRKHGQYWLGLILLFFVLWGYICCGQAVQNEKTALWLVEQLESVPSEQRQAEAVGVVISVGATENSSKYVLKEVRMQTAVGEVKLSKLIIYTADDTEIREGDRISVIGQISSFDTATNPGQFDFRAYQSSMGMYLQMYGQHIVVDMNSTEPFLGMLGQVRRYVRGIFMAVSPDTGGTLLAMVLGDKSELPDERQQLYLDSGIGHILTLSGLHLSLLGVGLYGGLRKKMTVSKWPAVILVSTLLFIYLRLIGSGISATRAAIAIGCSLIAGGVGKTYDSPSAAALGMVIILREYPLQIARPSFWLSFGAVLSLGLILPELMRWLRPNRKWAKTLLSVLVVWMVLMPVTAINQYVIQPYSILLNFVVVPLMGPVLIGCILVLAAGSISLPVGSVVSVPVRWAFLFVDELCRVAGKFPGNQIVVGCPSFGQLLVYAGVLTVFLFALHRQNLHEWEKQETGGYEETEAEGEEKPVRADKAKRWCILSVLCGLLAVILLFGIGRNRLEIVFLDVGQGDGIFLRMPNGATMMVDGGSSSETAIYEETIHPSLKWAGVRKLDYLVMTHLDSDHMNGLVDLLESGFPVGCLLVSEVTMDEKEVEEIKKIATQNGTRVVRIGMNDGIKMGKVEMKCISPETMISPQTENECSVVLELTYRNFSCLLTGDVEGKGERTVEDYVSKRPPYTLLKVAHHGSKYSTSETFLAAVRPAAAVISCGKKNSYGHPHEELLDRLEAVESEIYCTAECGAVMVNTDGIRWEIKGYVSQNP